MFILHAYLFPILAHSRSAFSSDCYHDIVEVGSLFLLLDRRCRRICKMHMTVKECIESTLLPM